jgi:hypothetical protein
MAGGIALVSRAETQLPPRAAVDDGDMDWAAFLCEYAHLIPPIESGSVAGLTGNNVIYRRELRERHRDVVEAGEWENYLHDHLRENGVCIPSAAFGHSEA